MEFSAPTDVKVFPMLVKDLTTGALRKITSDEVIKILPKKTFDNFNPKDIHDYDAKGTYAAVREGKEDRVKRVFKIKILAIRGTMEEIMDIEKKTINPKYAVQKVEQFSAFRHIKEVEALNERKNVKKSRKRASGEAADTIAKKFEDKEKKKQASSSSSKKKKDDTVIEGSRGRSGDDSQENVIMETPDNPKIKKTVINHGNDIDASSTVSSDFYMDVGGDMSDEDSNHIGLGALSRLPPAVDVSLRKQAAETGASSSTANTASNVETLPLFPPGVLLQKPRFEPPAASAPKLQPPLKKVSENLSKPGTFREENALLEKVLLNQEVINAKLDTLLQKLSDIENRGENTSSENAHPLEPFPKNAVCTAMEPPIQGDFSKHVYVGCNRMLLKEHVQPIIYNTEEKLQTKVNLLAAAIVGESKLGRFCLRKTEGFEQFPDESILAMMNLINHGLFKMAYPGQHINLVHEVEIRDRLKKLLHKHRTQ